MIYFIISEKSKFQKSNDKINFTLLFFYKKKFFKKMSLHNPKTIT